MSRGSCEMASAKVFDALYSPLNPPRGLQQVLKRRPAGGGGGRARTGQMAVSTKSGSGRDLLTALGSLVKARPRPAGRGRGAQGAAATPNIRITLLPLHRRRTHKQNLPRRLEEGESEGSGLRGGPRGSWASSPRPRRFLCRQKSENISAHKFPLVRSISFPAISRSALISIQSHRIVANIGLINSVRRISPASSFPPPPRISALNAL